MDESVTVKWITIGMIGLFLSLSISAFAPDAHAIRIQHCVFRNNDYLVMEYTIQGCKFKNFGIKGEGKLQ